jgi:hypothetical protein
LVVPADQDYAADLADFGQASMEPARVFSSPAAQTNHGRSRSVFLVVHKEDVLIVRGELPSFSTARTSASIRPNNPVAIKSRLKRE